jgi:CheY-like chemotaxis protein
MFFKHWPVLLVDDEPDVLSVSRLAMKNFDVFGLPLKIYTADSKAEAIRLMKDNVEVGCNLAVAFLDVVMETDSAGLELCEYIRGNLGNKLTQIFIRTGQPGIAPEREVVDKYDINGYFSKIEATEDKLYSLVKSSVRQYLSYGTALATVELSSNMIAAGRSRRRLLYAVSPVCVLSPEQIDTPRWLVVDDEVLFADETDGEAALKLLEKVRARDGMPLDPAGDRYVKGENGYQLIEVPSTPSRSEALFLFKSRFTPPDIVLSLMHGFVTQLAMAWHRSEDDRV